MQVAHLAKTFRSQRKAAGLGASVRSLFKPDNNVPCNGRIPGFGSTAFQPWFAALREWKCHSARSTESKEMFLLGTKIHAKIHKKWITNALTRNSGIPYIEPVQTASAVENSVYWPPFNRGKS